MLDECAGKNQELLTHAVKVDSASIKVARVLKELERLRVQLSQSKEAKKKTQQSISLTNIALKESEED